TSRRSTRSVAVVTSARPHTQSAIDEAISGALGFTVPLMNRTTGVTAITRPTATRPGAEKRRSVVMAVAMNAPAIAAVINRIRYTVRAPARCTHDAMPTTA